MVASTIYFAAKTPTLYTLWVFLSFFCLGGHFSTFPTLSAQLYGVKSGPKVYALLFTGIGSSSMFGFVCAKFLLQHLGFAILFALASAMTLFSFILMVCVYDKMDIKKQVAHPTDGKGKFSEVEMQEI